MFNTRDVRNVFGHAKMRKVAINMTVDIYVRTRAPFACLLRVTRFVRSSANRRTSESTFDCARNRCACARLVLAFPVTRAFDFDSPSILTACYICRLLYVHYTHLVFYPLFRIPNRYPIGLLEFVSHIVISHTPYSRYLDLLHPMLI